MRSAAAVSEVPQQLPQADTQDIDDFIYLMSHDVRASIRALLELPQWIVEDLEDAGVDLSGPVANSIEMMNRHTARLDRMLVDLLAYSRVGRMQEVVDVDVNACLDDVLGSLHIPDGMTLIRDIDCSHVHMGEQDALMLWTALISNSVKHHHKASSGKISVSARVEADMVRFSVIDDGPGIPEKFHAKALGAMTTLRPRDEVEGTGMGLANARKVAAHYGGYIGLSDVAGSKSGLRVDLVMPHGIQPKG